MLLGGGRHNEFVGNLLVQSSPTQVVHPLSLHRTALYTIMRQGKIRRWRE
jgi:hypothetical protein